jgi:hypothetical protein
MLDLCYKQLTRGSPWLATQDELLRLIAHLCLWQYRRDVLTLLEKEIVRCFPADENKDGIQFCSESLKEAFSSRLSLITENQAAVKSPAKLVEWLWLLSNLSAQNPRLK